MYPFIALLLYISFPLLCILAVTSQNRVGSVAERVVFGIALYEILLLSMGLILGLSHSLTVNAYLAFMSLIMIFLVIQAKWSSLNVEISPLTRYVKTWRGATVLFMAALIIVVFALEIGFDALYGNRHGDGLWYHVPRVMFWGGQHSFDAWVTPVSAQIGLPVGADLVLLHKILLGQGWGGSGFVTFLLSIGAASCVYLAALDLRLSRWHAALSAILFASFPAIGLRIWAVNSDIAAAFPALAAYVALHRMRDPKHGLAFFLILNATAIACKPTVAPLALLLGCFAIWRCRHKIAEIRGVSLPCMAAVLGIALVLASYWPVYMTFSDFMGGDYSRSHRSGNPSEFWHAVAMHSGHWLLEPLGYFTRFREDWELEAVKSVYNALGAQFDKLPDIWKPYPGQDLGHTGLASVIALPVLLAGLSTRARIYAIPLLLLAYIPLSGMINPQPFFARYNVILLAGFALLWGGTKIFLRGKRRWVLCAMVALNVCALLGVVSINIYLDITNWSKPGGLYHYISGEDRSHISKTLTGDSLIAITEGELEALLVGPEIAFDLSYLICPPDGNWRTEFERAAQKSNWLALVHNGKKSLAPGPEWEHPGSHTCPEVSNDSLGIALLSAGWRQYRINDKVDLWRFGH